jgi:hypothetical protein
MATKKTARKSTRRSNASKGAVKGATSKKKAHVPAYDRPRWDIQDNYKIKVIGDHKHKPGTRLAKQFAKLPKAKTVADFYKAGGDRWGLRNAISEEVVKLVG